MTMQGQINILIFQTKYIYLSVFITNDQDFSLIADLVVQHFIEQLEEHSPQ